MSGRKGTAAFKIMYLLFDKFVYRTFDFLQPFCLVSKLRQALFL